MHMIAQTTFCIVYKNPKGNTALSLESLRQEFTVILHAERPAVWLLKNELTDAHYR